jgi:hypothetical protein
LREQTNCAEAEKIIGKQLFVLSHSFGQECPSSVRRKKFL